MSWWFYKKNRMGKRQLWVMDVDHMKIMLIFGFLLAIIVVNATIYPTLFVIGSTGVVI